MWQKARILAQNGYEAITGKTIWVLAPPTPCRNRYCCKDRDDHRVIEANWRGWTANQTKIHMCKIELLPEFADDVPIIPYEEFTRSQ